jgi:chloride channel 7
MIHMGAAVGAGISQGHSTTLGIDTGLFRHFQVGWWVGVGW